MQGLKVLPTTVDEITRVNEIADGQMDARKTGHLCCTMPAGRQKAKHFTNILKTRIQKHLYNSHP